MEKKTPISDSLVGALSERAASYKVHRKFEIDLGTGTPLLPGRRQECYGNGEHDGFDCCCDECDHYSDCYREELEDEEDFKAAEQALVEHAKGSKTYTHDEVPEELGITLEELEAIDLLDEMGVPFSPDGSPLGVG